MGELGPKPEIGKFPWESYQEPAEERELSSRFLGKIRKSVKATLASTAMQLDPEVVARGIFLTRYHINDADEGEPRTVNVSSRIYAPNGTGCFVDLVYENHKRVRMSFTERFSHLYCIRGRHCCSEADAESKCKQEKIFELDFNEHRRKNPTKTSLASNQTLATIGSHLLGGEGLISNRKVFGLLVRAVGLCQWGENNGWPIAVARRRFKCGKGEDETDTEAIAGDKCEDADVDGCCVM